MLALDGQKTSCCYNLCTPGGGHSVCTVVQEHYERLCGAAQAAVNNPGPDNLARLQGVLDEATGVA